ncbi:hypothetical protein KQI52_14900 [bacterium]|nr:hypothetical protein [bacterium]
MKFFFHIVVLLVLAELGFAQAIPPYHLETVLSPGGIVQFSWEPGPVEGLIEDFEDGIAQDFEWWTPQGQDYPGQGYYSIENGYAQIAAGYGLLNWGSTVNSQIEFFNFTCELEMANMTSGNSHAILFRSDGPKDNDYNGYAFIISNIELFGGMYSVYGYINGLALDVIYWQWSDLINIGQGVHNTIKVVGVGDTFDFYINGTYVNSVTNPNFTDIGLVGFTNTSGNTVRYYDITCSHDAQLQDRSVEPQRGELVDGWFDDAGRPMDHPPVRYDEYERQLDRKREILHFVQDDIRGYSDQLTNELDEFVEYRIYRNGEFIGATSDTVFTDQLPAYGEYEYRITAYYDPEGESIPSVPATVNWQSVTYSLAPVNAVVPYTGGTITYGALLFNELPQSFQNVSYRTYATLPDGSEVGPLFQRTFTLAPGAYHSIPGMTQTIPPNAPPGNYFLHGRLYYQGQPVYEQTFQFDKMGGGE